MPLPFGKAIPTQLLEREKTSLLAGHPEKRFIQHSLSCDSSHQHHNAMQKVKKYAIKKEWQKTKILYELIFKTKQTNYYRIMPFPHCFHGTVAPTHRPTDKVHTFTESLFCVFLFSLQNVHGNNSFPIVRNKLRFNSWEDSLLFKQACVLVEAFAVPCTYVGFLLRMGPNIVSGFLEVPSLYNNFMSIHPS